jgi:branched-chain amino acid transport system permease protein
MNLARHGAMIWISVAVLLAALPFMGLSSRWIQLLALIGINTLLAQSMNIVGGYAGQISLGQAGVFAAGAYGSAALATKLQWPVWLSIPGGIAIAMLVGLVIALPAERVREFYLGMVTLAFGIIAFELLQYWTPVTGGSMGLSNIPSPVLNSLTVFGFAINLKLYCATIVTLVALMTLLNANLIQSHVGRAFVAVEGSDIAAASLGIRPGRTKHLAYVVSAAWAGLAGALYAHLTAFISPDSFDLWVSVSILVMAIFGGLRTFIGPFLGAAFFTLLPEMTQALKDYQLLAYGAILMISYLFLPLGLAGLLRSRTQYIREERLLAAPAAMQAEGRMPARSPALELRRIAKRFGGIVALDDVSFKVDVGTIHGLIGPNGSGKSTLVNVATGLYAPNAGEVICNGSSVVGVPPFRLVALGVARTFQNPLMFSGMTVRENVVTGTHASFRSGVFACLLDWRTKREEDARSAFEADAIIEQVGLTPYRNALAETLPYGQKRMLDLARALATKPSILILDEPAAGLSEPELEQLADLLRRLHARGMTVLLIEHHLDFLFNLVQFVTVLDHGEVIFDGSPAQARNDNRVIEAYLGNYARA